MAYNDLEQVYAFSYAANNAFNFTLNKEVGEKSNFRQSYIVMVSVLPGERSDSNAQNRTYNKDRRINFRFSLMELAALAFSLKGHATGQFTQGSTKFSKTKTESKWFTVSSGMMKLRTGDVPGVSIVVGQNGNQENKISTIIPLDQAYSLGSVLERIYHYGMDLEFQQNNNSTSYRRTDSGMNSQAPARSAPQQPADNNFDNDFGQDYPPF